MINNALLVDTRYLRNHVSSIHEEKKIASQLHEHIALMRDMDDPNISQQYSLILYEIEQLISYFEKMANTLDLIEQEAMQTSRSIKKAIEHGTATTENVTSNSFQL